MDKFEEDLLMKAGFILNPDDEFVRNLKKRIKANSGYCPCAIVKNQDTKCPCKDFREEGECHCGLYIKNPCEIFGEDLNEGWI